MEIVLKIVIVLCLTLLSLAAVGSVANHRVKAVRTIDEKATNASIFDDKVNAAIEDGWRLKQIVVNRGTDDYTHLIAFLER